MILGIIGAAHSGKSTVANYLIEQFGYSDYSFAGPLKDLCAKQFGWDRALLDDASPAGVAYKEELTDLWLPTDNGYAQEQATRRQVMQYLGTDVFRLMDPEHWVNIARRELVGIPTRPGIVFPDTRFRNEIALIHELGGLILRTIKQGGDTTAASGHASETELADYPADFTASAVPGDIAFLHEAADELAVRGRLF
jgi:hypothetical protein